MMEGVASKFACLQDDDSTDWVKPKEKGKKSKPINNDSKPNTGKSKKKNKANDEAKELQKLAFQTSNKKNKSKNKPKSQNDNTKQLSKQDAQYEEWKEKDEQLAKDTFAQDVEKALLLSKLDFEEQKATKKIMDEERARLALLDASKKPKTMSLGQFQQIDHEREKDLASQIPCDIKERNDFGKSKVHVMEKKDHLHANGNTNPHEVSVGSLHNGNDNGQFFANLHQDTLNLINHEKNENTTRNMSVTKNGVALNESALMKQFKDTVSAKDIEIAKLQSDNETLKLELNKIKNRYKGIRQILDQAELKEKVEILIEAEKLRKVRDEMSENISNLTKELEQSKTREHLLGDELRILQEYKIVTENLIKNTVNISNQVVESPTKNIVNISTKMTQNNEERLITTFMYDRRHLLQMRESNISIEWPLFLDQTFLNEKGKWAPGLWADNFTPKSLNSPIEEKKMTETWERNGGHRGPPTLGSSNSSKLLEFQGIQTQPEANNNWKNVMIPLMRPHNDCKGETYKQAHVRKLTSNIGQDLNLNHHM